MDRAGVDAWADTFAQLMAERKPQDFWALHPQDSLVTGQPDHDSLQYWLKGLSRLQCNRCPWTWGSAHVRILFRLWWDRDHRRGHVRMRLWGPQCRLCPPDAPGECQVSPSHIRPLLRELVLHILRTCYGDSPGQGSKSRAGDGCEACDLGVCFLQREPEPTRVSLAKSVEALESRGSGKGSEATTAGQGQLLHPGSGPLVKHARDPKPVSIPILVIDFMEEPFSEDSDFFDEGDPIVTIPFSLVDTEASHGLALGEVIGQGSICLAGSSGAVPEGQNIPVHFRAPIFPGQGSILETFELPGFLFGGQGSPPSPVGIAKGQGPISFSVGCLAPGNSFPSVSYVIGLLANGEGAITLPLSLTSIFRGQDSLTRVPEGRGRGDGGQSCTTDGHNSPLETHAEHRAASKGGPATFPFTFTDNAPCKDSLSDVAKGREKGASAEGPGSLIISQGSITIPPSVLRIAGSMGPGDPQRHGFVTFHHYKRRWLSSGSSRSIREEGAGPRRARRRPRSERRQDFWLWVSVTICALWLLCMFKLNLAGL
ncbi:PREDICTED: receptor-transporting protein 5 [Chinchilla lanigera]|uniref:receptor-transporting protein 5 n=1 Tax=Chinchilla lanigera TaxID=34839 RepID=UPI00038E978A|nr:PREDICTED: receptor-transporting protein 5 [Chinchilla lanigera]